MENQIDLILSRVLSGHASADDLLRLSEWLQADPKHREEFRRLKSYWDAEVAFSRSANPALTFERVRSEIRRRKSKRLWFALLPAAAVIALLLLIPFLFVGRSDGDERLYTYVSDKEKSEFYLRDSTLVILNKNSRLTYSEAYGKEKRQVWIDGEVYFDVTRNADKPFVVEMGDAFISVLGTVFVVKAPSGSDRITATLVEGSIRFEGENGQVTLSPNQRLTFDRTTGRVVDVSAVDTGAETAWKDDLLRYKSIAFPDLLKDLERIYHVRFEVENPKYRDSSVTVSGSFAKGQDVGQILSVIQRSLPFHWVREGDLYYIK